MRVYLVTVNGRFLARVRTTAAALMRRFPYSVIVGNHCDILAE